MREGQKLRACSTDLGWDSRCDTESNCCVSRKPSYAAALKNKNNEWQLEFSMDDHILPLDMTIYGAVHQHESRKTSGTPAQTNYWQNVYTVKYKKVFGPRQAPERESVYNYASEGALTVSTFDSSTR